jgi:hypothetical protein
MSLPLNSKKLSKTQIKSIENAVKEVGINAIHPDKMEEFAAYLVDKVKNSDE